MLVKGVDEDGEALGLVVPHRAQAGNAGEHDGVILAGDGQVIGGAERLLAQIGEPGEGGPVDGQSDVDLAPLHGDPVAPGLGAVGQAGETALQGPVRLRARGGQVDVHGPEGVQAVVDRAVQFQNLQLLLQEPYDGQKAFALEPALVQVTGGAVGRGHNHHAGLEQGFEQTPQDHGVGDGGHVELVEAQQPRPVDDDLGKGGQGIGDLRRPAGLDRLPEAVHPVVHFEHEGVEVDVLFRLDRRAREEHIHEHGLAAPGAAEQIEPLGSLLLAAAKRQPRLPATGPQVRRVAGQRSVQVLQLLRRQFLGHVGLDLPAGQQGAIGVEGSVGHGKEVRLALPGWGRDTETGTVAPVTMTMPLTPSRHCVAAGRAGARTPAPSGAGSGRRRRPRPCPRRTSGGIVRRRWGS